MLDFPRPDTVPFPRVWHEFHARDSNSDEIVKYRVEDLPEARFSDAVDFMIDNFAKEEIIFSSMSNIRLCFFFSIKVLKHHLFSRNYG